MGYREEGKPSSLLPYPWYCSKHSGLWVSVVFFLESLYIRKCWKTDALTVPAFLLVIVKDRSNTLPGELSWNIKAPCCRQAIHCWPKNGYFLSWWKNPCQVRLDYLIFFKNCIRLFFFPSVVNGVLTGNSHWLNKNGVMKTFNVQKCTF